MDVGEAEIPVPTQKVLSQISSGAVRVSFGELRQLAPPGTFTAENDRDRTLVELPLYEVLARLNPGLLMRRPTQKHVDVPPEVVGPFGGQAKVTISTAAAKPAPNATRAFAAPPSSNRSMPVVGGPAHAAAPSQPAAPVKVPPVVRPARATPGIAPVPVFARIRPSSSAPRSAPAQPSVSQAPSAAHVPPPLPVASAPVAQSPVVETAPAEEFAEPIFNRVTAPPAPPIQPIEPPAPPVFTPISPDSGLKPAGDTDVIQMPENYRPLAAAAAPITPIAPEAEAEPEPIRFSQPPERPVSAPAAPVPVTGGETRFITVSVAELLEAWPEPVRNEIAAQNLSGSWIGLPLGAVEGVMKTGRIAFPWKALRSWIKPPIPAAPSAYDTTMLELPLKTITPLFLAELRSNRAQRKLAVDEDIPDLFFNSQPVDANLPVVPVAPVMPSPVAPPSPAPVPAASPAPAFPAAVESARPADTNYFVWKDNAEESEEAPVFVKKGTNTPGTAFLNRYATPNEIVSKTAALNGVDGALIALPDGLLVASHIPTNMNAETIAAFLPQIFGRVSQCTRELRLGELNNLNFTVGNIPWKIFRVGSIYFAAFGRPGVPLPTAQLVGLAAELDRKAK